VSSHPVQKSAKKWFTYAFPKHVLESNHATAPCEHGRLPLHPLLQRATTSRNHLPMLPWEKVACIFSAYTNISLMPSHWQKNAKTTSTLDPQDIYNIFSPLWGHLMMQQQHGKAIRGHCPHVSSTTNPPLQACICTCVLAGPVYPENLVTKTPSPPTTTLLKLLV
jgi:hypothetical protein